MNPRCCEKEMKPNEYTYNFEDNHENMSNGVTCPPVYECPQERVCERYIIHEIPHFIPINTKIVNHHIYRHTFTPCYTMSECDTCENVYDTCCKNF